MMIFNVTEEVNEKAYFLNMAELCVLKRLLGLMIFFEVKRICEPGAHAGDKTRPI